MFKTSFSSSMPKSADTHVILCEEGAKLSAAAAKIDKKSEGLLSSSAKAAGYKGQKHKFHTLQGVKKLAPNVVLAGLGKTTKLAKKDYEAMGSALYKTLSSIKSKKIFVEVDEVKGHKAAEIAADIAYGMSLNSYRFDKYKSTQKKESLPTVSEVTFVLKKAEDAKKRFNDLQKTVEGVFLARDLLWEPANELYPETFAQRVKKELSPLGVKIKILNEAQMKKLKMGSLLSVGHGSIRESYMVVMEWDGRNKSDRKKSDKPLALIGKGVTFDTGGISLKPGAGMWDMKWDMGGAAAVVGAMKSLAGRKAKAHVVAAIGLVENMPSDRATRPGDVVKSMSGKTIEILNTDAEGRLVLVDVMTYMQKNYDPKTMIDLATLTGAIIIALGHEYAGAFGNDDATVKELMCAGEGTGDRVWHMPLAKGWDKAIDSDIADVKNISLGRDGGSATAASFLKRFVDKGRNWVHLDIAGMVWNEQEKPSRPKGGTGFGVRLLDQYVRQTLEK